MTSSPEPPQIDPPECPICLQVYDSDTTIPRVLSCGHSACQLCLAQLPHSSLSHLIRCPACTQLVKLPHPQGPTALPKNIDLLRFSLSFPQQRLPNTNPLQSSPIRRRFPPQLYSPEIYSTWKFWVLPKRTVLIDESSGFGRVGDAQGLCQIIRCRLVEGQRVGLVEIGRFEGKESLIEYGYVGRIVGVLSCMSDARRNELEALLRVSLRNTRVCNVLGLWLDDNSGCVYLVTERKNDGLLNLEDDDWMPIGVELCEAFVGLKSEGFVCGCLSLSCLDVDEFGHVYVDLGAALAAGRRIRECVSKMDGYEVEELVTNMSNMDVFVSPEMVLEFLRKEGVELEMNDLNCRFDYSSDVWLLACVLVRVLRGKQFVEGMYDYLRAIFERKSDAVSECKVTYQQWVEMVNAAMLEILVGSSYSSLQDILLKCFVIDQGSRPMISDVWKSIRGSSVFHSMARFSGVCTRENVDQCLVLGELCDMLNGSKKESRMSVLDKEHDHCADPSQVGEVKVDDVVQELCAGKGRCKDLQGHLDCITGLCVGGGFLLSSSLDKTVKVWSLQDFTLVHTFRGHEHRVMAVVFVDQEKPLCISADSGGGIFAWEVMMPFSQEPLNKWYEEKDWRYSGIHALAISEFGSLYTGSGDRLIKAWSLRDHTLLCSMEGHKSVVSSLALCNGVLYSGSWDGTVRLWCLHDHSPLAVFGEDMPGMMSSVLSLHADQSMVIAAHENGHIKIWMNDELKASRKVHGGAILALAKEEEWVFTGGWDKIVNFQEIKNEEFEMEVREVGSITSHSVITALLYVGGILFVGSANKLIKVARIRTPTQTRLCIRTREYSN